jgi:hypothetical protein
MPVEIGSITASDSTTRFSCLPFGAIGKVMVTVVPLPSSLAM